MSDTSQRFGARLRDVVVQPDRIEQIEPRSPVEEPGTEAEKLQRQMQHHDQARSEYFEKLRQIGGDNIEHQEIIGPYLRKYLGEGLIGKIDLDGQEIYVTRLLPTRTSSSVGLPVVSRLWGSCFVIERSLHAQGEMQTQRHSAEVATES